MNKSFKSKKKTNKRNKKGGFLDSLGKTAIVQFNKLIVPLGLTLTRNYLSKKKKGSKKQKGGFIRAGSDQHFYGKKDTTVTK